MLVSGGRRNCEHRGLGEKNSVWLGYSRWPLENVLLAHLLPNQCLLLLYLTHTADLSMCLPLALASHHSCQRGSEGHAPLLVSVVTNEPT